MIEQVYSKLKNQNLVDWGVVSVGIRGVPNFSELLPLSYVKDFANFELEKIPNTDQNLDIIVDIATNYLSVIDLREMLDVLCEKYLIDISLSERKWRVASLDYIISDAQLNPVYGLLKISEFWMAWNWPDDSPQSIRGDEGVSLDEYYSQKRYNKIVADHKNWIADEFSYLKKGAC